MKRRRLSPLADSQEGWADIHLALRLCDPPSLVRLTGVCAHLRQALAQEAAAAGHLIRRTIKRDPRVLTVPTRGLGGLFSALHAVPLGLSALAARPAPGMVYHGEPIPAQVYTDIHGPEPPPASLERDGQIWHDLPLRSVLAGCVEGLGMRQRQVAAVLLTAGQLSGLRRWMWWRHGLRANPRTRGLITLLVVRASAHQLGPFEAHRCSLDALGSKDRNVTCRQYAVGKSLAELKAKLPCLFGQLVASGGSGEQRDRWDSWTVAEQDPSRLGCHWSELLIPGTTALYPFRRDASLPPALAPLGDLLPVAMREALKARSALRSAAGGALTRCWDRLASVPRKIGVTDRGLGILMDNQEKDFIQTAKAFQQELAQSAQAALRELRKMGCDLDFMDADQASLDRLLETMRWEQLVEGESMGRAEFEATFIGRYVQPRLDQAVIDAMDLHGYQLELPLPWGRSVILDT